MVFISAAVLLVLFGVSTTIRAETGFGEVVHDWPRGFTGRLNVTMEEDVEQGWTMSLTFSSPLKRLHIWRAKVVSQSDDGKVCCYLHILETTTFYCFELKRNSQYCYFFCLAMYEFVI